MVLATKFAAIALAVALASSSASAQSAASSASSGVGVSDPIVGISPSSNATNDLIGWFGCSPVTFADELEYVTRGTSATDLPPAQCATYKAPLCHAGVCTDAKRRSIDVFFKRIVATGSDPASKPNVWFLQGGPGAASPTMELAMTSLYKELNGNVNVYTMDHRGTGRSTLLDCVASQVTTSGSPLGADIDVSEIAACAQELQIKYGDLAAFSITSAASDLSHFISTFQTGSKTFVYGVSYGSALVERLIHLGTKEIVGYILDGVSTTSGADAKDGMYMSNWDVNFGEVADHFLDLCATDALCASKFPTMSLRDIVAQAGTNSGRSLPCGWHLSSSSSSSSSSLAKNVLGLLLMRSRTRAAIPAIAYRLLRCSSADALVLTTFMDAYIDSLVAPAEEDAFESTLLYSLIVFSEMWESPPPTASVLTDRFANAIMSTGPIASMFTSYCSFTHDNASECVGYVYASPRTPPIAYKKDKYWNTAATIPDGASVLVMSGKLDPQTPHKYAERLLAALDGTQKELVTFDYSEHGTLFATKLPGAARGSGTCGMMVLASYVRADGDLSKLDKTCVDSLTLSFELSKDDALLMFNSTDAYDGKFVFTASDDDAQDGETEEKYLTSFLIVLALAVVLAAVAGALYWRKRRAARAAAQTGKTEDALPPPATEAESGVVASPSAMGGSYLAAEEAHV